MNDRLPLVCPSDRAVPEMPPDRGELRTIHALVQLRLAAFSIGFP